jgi:hypothetical protein
MSQSYVQVEKFSTADCSGPSRPAGRMEIGKCLTDVDHCIGGLNEDSIKQGFNEATCRKSFEAEDRKPEERQSVLAELSPDRQSLVFKTFNGTLVCDPKAVNSTTIKLGECKDVSFLFWLLT